jgi:non-canonical (house-cleaning) NTP pyrophosphatase
MSEYQADQEDTVLAYVRLKSGERPFNRYGEGTGFTRQAAKATKGKQPLYSNNVIDLAAERAKRAKRK